MTFTELQKRIHFLNQQIDVLFKRVWEWDKLIAHYEKATLKMELSLDDFDERIKTLKQDQRKLGRARTNKRLRLIQNNLQSVTRQLQDRREPKAYIPEEQWEAFEEFLIKLKKEKK